MTSDAPVRALERVFADIAATRMAGLPILNPALRVETVGFRAWEGRWVGVLVTPWSIVLVLLAGQEALAALGPDQKQAWRFPSGSYEFMGLHEGSLSCQMCPLLSPVAEFATQEDAREFAQTAMTELFRDTIHDQTRGEELADMIEDARLRGTALAQQQVSRRDFLRMPLLGR